jgi:hypothetical protein
MNQGLNFDFTGVAPNNSANNQFYWGYQPGANGCMDGFDVRDGLYRSESANGVGLVSMRLDSIKLTTTSANMPGL